MTSPESRLSVKRVSKSFGPVSVLKSIDLDIGIGQVHALMGANGAGKSTLSNIISGLFPASSGELFLDGERFLPDSIKNAKRLGVQMVMQELNTINNLSVAENICLADMPRRIGFIDRKAMREKARKALALVGLNELDADTPMEKLGVGQQQLVEIAATIVRPCRLLILDEPTAALTDPEIENLFSQVRQLVKTGCSVMYISHRMDEIQEISDQISVLRDGVCVASEDARDMDSPRILSLMTGEETRSDIEFTRRKTKELALEIKNLNRLPLLKNIDLRVYRGEILGISGLIGSGRTELLRSIVAADAKSQQDSGKLFLNGSETACSIAKPSDALNHGIGLIPEDRKQHALMLDLSIGKNFSIANLRKLSGSLGAIKFDLEREMAVQYCNQLALKYDSLDQPIKELSGGNQQKVILARMLYKDCDILLVDEPTRGIDMQTKKRIYQLLDELANSGKAVVMVSSETSELTALCDRIAVMSDGCIAEIFERGEWTPERLTTAAFSAFT